jgi:phosphatidylglycerophosphatase A
MTTRNSQALVSWSDRLAAGLATGLGLGLVMPAPGSIGSLVWGLPLAWGIGHLPGLGWQLATIVLLNLIGIPLTTLAGRALGGKKDNQAIIWDEIATVPVVFLFVPITNWRIALAGFAAHRLLDITKPPPARHLERLPEGLGVMADDWIAAVYACALFVALVWLDAAAGWNLFQASGR